MRRWFICTLVGAVTFGSLGGCNGKDAGVLQSKEGKPSKEVEMKGTINIFSNSGDNDEGFNDRFGNYIKKKFPELQINYIKRPKLGNVEELLTAGQEIDLIWDSIGYFMDTTIPYNLNYDMSQLIEQHNIDLSKYDSTIVNAMKQMSNGSMYGVPIIAQSLVTYYNKDLFDKFGITYPKDGMTWDEQIELGKNLNRLENGVNYLGHASSTVHIARMNQFSLPFIDLKTGKSAINTEQWKKFYQKTFIDVAQQDSYKAWYASHKVNEVPGVTDFTKSRNLAMYVYLSGYHSSPDLKDMNWDMVSAPTWKELPGVGPQLYPWYFAIASISKNKDKAMEVIKFLLSDEYQTAISKQGYIPASTEQKIREVYGQDAPTKGKNLKAVLVNKPAPISQKHVYDLKIDTIMLKDISNVVMGKSELNTKFRQAEEESNKILDSLAKK